MYYSKSSSLSVPKNYAGNAFRVIDESDRTYKKSENESPKNHSENEFSTPKSEHLFQESKQICEEKSSVEPSSFSSIFSSISVEDILILGLIFVIHEENPNDPTLILLLILLLAK